MEQKNIDRKLLIDILDDFAFGSHDIEKTADRIFASIRNTNIINEWLDKNGCPEIKKQVKEEAKELCEIHSLKDVLWQYLNTEHNLILLDSEVYEIIHLIDKFRSENKS